MPTTFNKHENPLLECLVIFTKLYQRPFTAEALIADLPVEPGRTTPKLFTLGNGGAKSAFSRASKRAGFSSTIVNYTLADFSKLLLPVILVLKDEKACILTDISEDRSHAKIILPELGDGENWVKIEDLEKEYVKYAFLIKPEHHYKDARKRVLKHEQHHWFWDTLKFSKSIYYDVIAASLLINLFVLATPLFTMNVYDRVVPNNAIDTMWILATGVIVVFLFDLLLKLLRTYFLENAAKKSDVIMSSIIFEKVMNLKMAVRPRSVGSFANNLKDFETVRGFFTASTLSVVIDLPFAIIFLLVIYIIGGSMVMIPITIGVLILLYSFIVEKPMRESIESTYEAAAYKNAILVESLNGIETIKAMGINGQPQWKWEESTGDIAGKGLKSRVLSSSISSIVNFMIQFNSVAIIIAGVYAINEKELSMGALIAVMILGSRVLAPLGQVAALIANFQHSKTAFETLDNIMQLPVEREEGKQFVERPSFKGKIEFQKVSFTYPDTAKKALDNISFIIEPGEAVGIIGTNGSGKTTIEKMILGLYDPDEGSILIDGIDIMQIDPSDLRRHIGYVPQDIVLFQGTLKENIIVRAPDSNDEDTLHAASIGGVDNFANIHPMGYDMPVGERGEGLSMGQRQAVGVARAFIYETPILLMDEPSNAMDSRNEGRLVHSLKTHKRDHTMIMISHKNTMLDLTDRLLLMDNGKLVLDGEKGEVISKLNVPKEKKKGGGDA